jgi:Subtilase family
MHRSRSRTGNRLRGCWARVAVLGLVAGAVSGLPGADADLEASRSGAPMGGETGAQREVVTLATGDRVAVSSRPDGRTIAHLLPGSPNFGEPMRTVTLAGDLYLRPRHLGAAEARRLDASMFNVSRLARLGAADGAIPVRVTFDADTRPHRVPGIDVAPGTTRTTGSGDSVVRGAYDLNDQPTAAGTWRGVTSVSLRGRDGSDAEPVADDYELHTLTVNVRNRHGDPANCAAVVVMNIDDARLFNWLDFCAGGGRTKLSVPGGNYGVIAVADQAAASSITATQRLAVDADTEVTVSARDATARVRFPKLPGAKPQEATFHYIRSAATRGSFSFSFGFSRGFPLYVEPSAVPAIGDLRSGLRATLRIPHEKRPSDLVESFDWQRGVPADLSYTHDRAEFARVTTTYHSDGRQRQGMLGHGTAAFMPGQSFDFVSVWPMRSPLKRRELYLGDPDITWYPFTSIGWNTELGAGSRHYRPRQRLAESWFRGPLAAGAGVAVRKPPTGRNCPACRVGDVIRLNLAPFTDAHPDHWGYKWGRNPWVLSRGQKVVDKGGWPVTEVEVPAGKARYRLQMTNSMPKRYALSTRAQTVWGFSSATGNRVLPLLMPRYGLPVDAMNRLPAGRTSFRLAVPRLGDDRVRVEKPSVKVSYNGGKTWKRAEVVRRSSEVFRVRLVNPKPGDRPRYGSLRVRAEDRAGNVVNQTVKRAWRIRGGGDGSSAGQPDGPGDGIPRQACGAVGERAFRCLALVGASGDRALDARADPAGYGAHELRDAYNLPAGEGAGQTVAVVVAGDYPTAAKDLNVYRKQFGLPACTVASGCFTKLNQDGVEGEYPRPDRGWALEAALDLQMISASCPRCKLVLVEANSPYFGPMLKAVDTAAANADVVSNSYGASEFTGIRPMAKHFDVDGVPMTVSAGNFGYQPANFPASAPSVISVGGTALRHADNDRGWRESAWWSGSSGCSAYFAKPSWQSDAACHMRTIADVAAVGDPATGVAVYDSFGFYGEKGWFVLGGTSTGAPLVAGMIAAGGDADRYDGADLYANAGTDALYDVHRGSNGFCKGSYMCTGRPGYDAPTGNGTPNGLEAFTDVTP